jgi:hypothetical protein
MRSPDSVRRRDFLMQDLLQDLLLCVLLQHSVRVRRWGGRNIERQTRTSTQLRGTLGSPTYYLELSLLAILEGGLERRWTNHGADSKTQRRASVGARCMVLGSLESLGFTILAKLKDWFPVWFRYIQLRRSNINVPKYSCLRWPPTSLVALLS